MPAGKLTKYVEGQRIREIHARTHNTLVDAELERRVGTPKPQKTPRGSMSPLTVELAWEEEVELPPGSAVAIYAPLYEPADDASAPFDGVRFFARTATTEDIESGHFAITDGPIPAAVGAKYAIGTGHIPAARWAQVDVANPAHTFAEPEENETILASGESGRFPILWMPAAASGVVWCVVLLASSGSGGGPTMIMAFVACTEPPDAPGGTFTVANPWTYTPPDDPDPASWDLSGDWLVMDGALSHLQILDESDDPVLIEVADPLFKVPTTGDYCLIVGPPGATSFQLIERRCGGGGPTP